MTKNESTKMKNTEVNEKEQKQVGPKKYSDRDSDSANLLKRVLANLSNEKKVLINLSNKN